ncbi:MAG: hypothetical protein KatS3mg085_523 [Candidatus Dojkabacteria bacterium]|nr:MAG: hypothetical protein KatS3mg085_523 [Candidatus Dojkabacteria bacterium]
MVLFNLKTYPQASGINLDKYLLALHSVVVEYPNLSSSMVVAPTITDLFWAKRNFPELNFCSQRIDVTQSEKSTGLVTTEILNVMNIDYVFVNHPENKEKNLTKKLEFLSDKGFKTVVFTTNLDEVKTASKFNPQIIVYENSKLKINEKTYNELKNLSTAKFLLYGGGIKKYDDVLNIKKLGFDGIAVGSGFIETDDPKTFAYEILNLF